MKIYLFAGAAMSLVLTSPVWAQEPTPQAQESSIVDELIVTAQKREESMQDVPIAVSAFSQNAMKAQGIDGARDLVQSVPNVSFQRRNTRTNFQIRGIGSQLSAVGGDDGVGIHLNNAPSPSTSSPKPTSSTSKNIRRCHSNRPRSCHKARTNFNWSATSRCMA